jgi:Domain of unknown function (DUF2703)
LLALDLSTCSRCTGSLSNIEQAIAILQPVIAIVGTVIQFHKILVKSEAQAQQLQFISSPTIRVNGREIISETTESCCSDCSEISGSSEGTLCRTWFYQGEKHTEAPVGMIVDAILSEIYRNQPPVTVTSNYEITENLKQFFHDKAETAKSCGKTQATPTGCCRS